MSLFDRPSSVWYQFKVATDHWLLVFARKSNTSYYSMKDSCCIFPQCISCWLSSMLYNCSKYAEFQFKCGREVSAVNNAIKAMMKYKEYLKGKESYTKGERRHPEQELENEVKFKRIYDRFKLYADNFQGWVLRSLYYNESHTLAMLCLVKRIGIF